MADRKTRLLKRAQRKGFAGKIVKLFFNISPLYRRTGGKIVNVSNDFRQVDIRIPLNRKTRNYVGTVFGGSMFAATDPIYMFQLIQLLGDNYIVWDKHSEIHFQKPGTSTLFSSFEVDDELIEEIKSNIAEKGSYTVTLPVLLTNKEKMVIAKINKTIYTASKAHYKQRKKATNP